MGLTVGELNVQLEANTKEFNARLDEVEERITGVTSTAQTQTARTSASFISLAKAIGTVNLAIGAAAVQSKGFRGILTALGIAVPQLRLALFALGAVIAVIGLFKFAGEAIQLSAAFEQTSVALETLTGSAQAAEAVLEEVNDIVLETPFALTELANVARQMAIVFGDSTEQIVEFTKITADIAAISGKSVEQIGGQIQRAVVSGLASAEVLKEAGITQLLLEQAGATDVATLRGEALLEAFRGLTAEGGRAFGAAARQTQTLAGALSNAQIAVTSFKREFGDIISPAAVRRANATEDAFVSFRAALVNIGPIIAAVATVLATILAFQLRVTGFAVRALTLAISTIGPFLTAFQVLLVGIAVFLDTTFKNAFTLIAAAFKLFTGDIAGAADALRNIIGFADSPVFELLGNTIQTAAVAGEDFVNRFRGLLGSTAITQKFADAIGFSTEATKVFGQTARDAAKGVEELTERTEAQVEALEILKEVGSALRATTIQDRIDALGEEIGATSTLIVAKQDQALKDERLLELARERARLQSLVASAEAGFPSTIARVNEQIAALGKIDPAAATQFATLLQEQLVAAGGELTEQIVAAATVSQAIIEFEKQQRLDAEKEIAAERLRLAEEAARAAAAATVELQEGVREAQLEAITDERIRALAVLQDEIAATIELGEISGNEVLTQQRLLQLTEERVRLEKELAEAQRAQREAAQVLPDVLGRVNESIAKIAEIDPARAEDLATQLAAALQAAGDDPEALVKAAGNFGEKLKDVLEEIRPETFGESVGESVGVGISRALAGQDVNFGQTFADALTTFGQPALNELFEDAVANFGDLLDDVLQSASGFLEGISLGGLGESFGKFGEFLKGPLGKATIGLVGQGISAALRSDEVTSQAARTVSSAVESTARVRGIVAGPTSIAIAQVDRAISDAFVETNFILRRIEENTRATATQTSDTGTGSVPSGGTSEATQALANEGPSFL